MAELAWHSGVRLVHRAHPDLHPLPLLDGHRALRWVRHGAAGYGIDPVRIGVLRFSAGVHLAACVAVGVGAGLEAPGDDVASERSALALAALGYPVISFEESGTGDRWRNLLGPDPNEATRRSLSVERQVTAGTPSSFLWHTAEDAKVTVANSLLFARALADQGVPVELHVFPRGQHGSGLALDDPSVGRWRGLFESWLRSYGWVR